MTVNTSVLLIGVVGYFLLDMVQVLFKRESPPWNLLFITKRGVLVCAVTYVLVSGGVGLW